MDINNLPNQTSIMTGSKVKESAGLRSDAPFVHEPASRKQSAKFPVDQVTLDPQRGIEIRPGPTPGHNIIKITNLKTGEVTEIPRVSEADLTAYVQNLLMSE